MSNSPSHHKSNDHVGVDSNEISAHSSLGIPSPLPHFEDVDTTLGLHSSGMFSTQTQGYPTSGQLRLQQHRGVESYMRRFSPMSLSSNQVGSQSNTVNINFFVGNNSTINFNVINANSSSLFEMNNSLTTSSTYAPIQNHVDTPPSFNFLPSYVPFDSVHEPIINGAPDFTESLQIYRSHQHHSCPRGITRGVNPSYMGVPNFNVGIPTAVPMQRGIGVISSTHQGQLNSPSEHVSHHERSTIDSTRNLWLRSNRNNSTYNGDASRHESTQYYQTSEHHPIQAPQEPRRNDPMLEPRGSLFQANNPIPSIETKPEAKKRLSIRGIVDHTKPGSPYECEKCGKIYFHAQTLSAHIATHYKGETPTEKKARRKEKITEKDLHIVEFGDGITIMPGKDANKGGCSSSVKIKKEYE